MKTANSRSGSPPGSSLWGATGGARGRKWPCPPTKKFRPPPRQKSRHPPSNFFLGGQKATGGARGLLGGRVFLQIYSTDLQIFYRFTVKIALKSTILAFTPPVAPPENCILPLRPPRWGGENFTGGVKKKFLNSYYIFAPPAW